MQKSLLVNLMFMSLFLKSFQGSFPAQARGQLGIISSLAHFSENSNTILSLQENIYNFMLQKLPYQTYFHCFILHPLIFQIQKFSVQKE